MIDSFALLVDTDLVLGEGRFTLPQSLAFSLSVRMKAFRSYC
jgi:hypothetical protein